MRSTVWHAVQHTVQICALGLALVCRTTCVAQDGLQGDTAPAAPSGPELIMASQTLNLSQSHSPELVAQIQSYHQLIAAHDGAPGIEWAMWDLGRLYAMNNTVQAIPVDDSVERACDWMRRAAETADPESTLWREIRLGLAAQLRRQAAHAGAVAESREILNDLTSRFPDDAALQVRCLEQWVQQLVIERQFAEAERVCRQLLTTTQFDIPERLHACRVMALNGLLQGRLKEFGQEGVPDEWLDALLADYPGHDVVRQGVESIRHLRQNVELGRVHQQSAVPMPTQGGWLRGILIAGNVLAAVGLGLHYRSRFRKGVTP